MIRLLIADDEKMIRETISHIIDWKSLGVEVVGICKNGLEAYDAILDEYPDIVLTDIHMPKLSGLELIQKITETHDNIQFIILSGYNEFSYAREAMKYGIKHYILKPCSEEEIIEAVSEAIKEHDKQISLHYSKSQIAVPSRFRENLMYSILLQLLSSEQNLKEVPSVYETYLDFYHTPYQMCYFYFLKDTLVSSCIKEVQKIFRDNNIPMPFTCVYVKNTLLFFFADILKDYCQIDSAFENLSFHNLPPVHTFQRETYTSLFALLQTLCQKVKRYETIYLYSGAQSVTICNYNYIFQHVLTLSHALSVESDEARHTDLLEDLKRLLYSVKDTELLRSMTNSLLIRAMQNTSTFTSADIAQFMIFVGSISSNKEICDFLFEKLNDLYPVPSMAGGKYKPFVREILNYTKEHISDPDLTLKWIVENHLFMNVDYVSRQFVLQTGVKFSAYLNDLRIKKAKQLLINCDSEKIYYVAEQVGCGNNPQYFSHLFKKYTKMTPKEYIQKMK